MGTPRGQNPISQIPLRASTRIYLLEQSCFGNCNTKMVASKDLKGWFCLVSFILSFTWSATKITLLKDSAGIPVSHSGNFIFNWIASCLALSSMFAYFSDLKYLETRYFFLSQWSKMLSFDVEVFLFIPGVTGNKINKGCCQIFLTNSL